MWVGEEVQEVSWGVDQRPSENLVADLSIANVASFKDVLRSDGPPISLWFGSDEAHLEIGLSGRRACCRIIVAVSSLLLEKLGTIVPAVARV